MKFIWIICSGSSEPFERHPNIMEWKFGRNQTNGKQIRSRLSTIIAMKRMLFSNFLQFCEVSFCHYFSEWTKIEAIPSLINLYSLKWKHQNHWLSHWSYSSTRNSPFSNTPSYFDSILKCTFCYEVRSSSHICIAFCVFKQ